MRLDNAVYLAALLGSNIARGATVPSDPWKSLTPSKTLSGATTNFDGSFAISLQTVGTIYGSGNASVPGGGSASTTADPENGKLRARGAVSQISDGQLQGNSAPVSTIDTESVAAASTPASVVNQITDGQIQQQSAPTSAAAASVVNQITDGQIQQQSAPTSAAAASVVNQITDGQIQQQSAAPTSVAAASVVNQITDGQIQKQSAAAESAPASVVNQITDGQIQHQTSEATSASVAAQITDGQVQKQSLAAESVTPSAAAPSKPAASQEGDGQIQGNNSTKSSSSSGSDSEYPETRVSKDALSVTLHDGILRDSKGRIGSIVANRQFQFDGPPPQAGAIYAAGWSIKDDTLALGDSTKFFQCKSGDFYNIYDQTIGGQCSEVKIKVLKIVN